jgi:hypothetical protein
MESELSKGILIKEAVELSEKVGNVFIATADSDSVPHLATAGRLSGASGNRVVVSAWFCPATVKNLNHKRSIALVIWDAVNDSGHQLIGEVEKIEEIAMLNGYAPEIEISKILPQTKRDLIVRVDKIFAFSRLSHSDIEEYTSD